MKTRHVISGAVVALLVAWLLCVMLPNRPFSVNALVARSLLPPAPSDDELYPRPVDLPNPTGRPLAELLEEYESAIRTLSPETHAVLQPGLSNEELDRLEQEYSIVLSADMRALYSWKNGSDLTKDVTVFPYMYFVPLGEALAARDAFRNSANKQAPDIRELAEDWLNYRYSWVEVLSNYARDGYFYDPERRDEASCFFSCGEGPGYMFYPAIGNYIEQLLESHRTGRLAAGDGGVTVKVDRTYDQEIAFLNQFGTWVE